MKGLNRLFFAPEQGGASASEPSTQTSESSMKPYPVHMGDGTVLTVDRRAAEQIKKITIAEMKSKRQKELAGKVEISDEEFANYQKYLETRQAETDKQKKNDDLETMQLKYKEEVEKKVQELKNDNERLKNEYQGRLMQLEIMSIASELKATNPEHVFLLVRDKIMDHEGKFTIKDVDDTPVLSKEGKPITMKEYLTSWKEQNKAYFQPEAIQGSQADKIPQEKAKPSVGYKSALSELIEAEKEKAQKR